jgi:autonomous glycyl radical cofactor GrcA
MTKVASNHRRKSEGALKAGALMCPKCCVEYLEVEVDFEDGGTVLHDVEVLRCPTCEEEVFTPEQYDAIRARIRSAVQP